MTDILLDILRSALAIAPGWLILFSFWWFRDFDRLRRFAKRHKRIATALAIGAFLFVFSILFLGLNQFLGFVPQGWGTYDEDGNFHPTKSTMAVVLAFLLTYCFAHVIIMLGEEREENRWLAVVADMRRDALQYRSRGFLIEERNKTKATLAVLRHRLRNIGPLSDEEMEIEVLDELLDRLESLIGQTKEPDLREHM